MESQVYMDIKSATVAYFATKAVKAGQPISS